ncbi:hypothetical protein OAV24_02515 [Gammaproteobacteria bacterium]|nr:hypothetical protein [Gammaproteobacteria bacterium]
MKKILLIAALVFAFYFVASPYQNCLRTERVSIFHRMTLQVPWNPTYYQESVSDYVRDYQEECQFKTDW